MTAHGLHQRPGSARARMVMELRLGGVSNARILSAMERTPRDAFVPEAFRDRAYSATALPIACSQTVSHPVVVARMTEALDVGERMKVLEIGTGSGYQAAILAALCRRLYTVERHAELLAEAEARFRALRLTNITAIAGDGAKGWPAQAPFQRIMVTAAAPTIPEKLLDQLADGGIMVAPVGDARGQRLLRIAKAGGEITETDMGPVRFVPLLEG